MVRQFECDVNPGLTHGPLLAVREVTTFPKLPYLKTFQLKDCLETLQ